MKTEHDLWRTAILLLLFTAACNYSGLGDPPAENDRDEITVAPQSDEGRCDILDVAAVTPPEWALEPDIGCDRRGETYCFRLNDALREVAAAHDPVAALEASAEAFEEHLENGDRVSAERGRALADLSVSGALSHETFVADPPNASDITTAGPAAAAMALDRAYRTLWALRGPPAHRADARLGLGWVAVSPADDLPARPVNVAATTFAQSDLPVAVDLEDGSTLTLRARLTIATTAAPPETMVPDVLVGSLPNLDAPILPASGSVMIYIHGHSSRAEESDTLVTELLSAYRERGQELTVISVDLPGSGYTDRVDPGAILAVADPGLGQDVLLRFIESFVVSFVDALDAHQPGLVDRIDAVLGGSLGGNLTLRLGERADELPWVRRAVAWSPVSIDYSWTRAKLVGGGDGGFMDVIKHEAVRRTHHESTEAEDRGARARYFVDGVMSVRKQSNYWYRDGWACGENLVSAGLHQLGEVYDSRLRRFHYRLAYEQLVFSHLETSAESGDLRFRSLSVPLLLIAGDQDNAVPMQTHFFVERLAPYLETPGETLFFTQTGHALHAERPHMLATAVVGFVEAH